MAAMEAPTWCNLAMLAKTLDMVEPVYRAFKGWQKALANVRNYNDFPLEALDYFNAIEDFTGARIKIISVSPERDGTVIRV